MKNRLFFLHHANFFYTQHILKIPILSFLCLLLCSFLFPFLLTTFICIDCWLSSFFCCGWFRRGALSRWLITCCIEFVIVIVMSVVVVMVEEFSFLHMQMIRMCHTDWKFVYGLIICKKHTNLQSLWLIQFANMYGCNPYDPYKLPW